MRVIEEFGHKGGKAFILENYPTELKEIYEVISRVDLFKYRTKVSKEKTMPGKMLYSPIQLNNAFKTEFKSLGWSSGKNNWIILPFGNGAFREMNFIPSSS